MKLVPELSSALVLYFTGGSHTTIHDTLMRSGEDDVDGATTDNWEAEKAAYAAEAPRRLVQLSHTFFRAVAGGDGDGTDQLPPGAAAAAAVVVAAATTTATTAGTGRDPETVPPPPPPPLPSSRLSLIVPAGAAARWY
jgi:hypothetical protein